MKTEDSAILGYLLVAARVVLSWFMLWPFFDKLFGLGFQTPAGLGMVDGGSPSAAVVFVTKGVFADFFNSLAGNAFIDWLLMIGLLGIGLGLLLGVASRITCVTFTVFLVLMSALVVPPTDNPLVDYRLTWIILTWIVYFGGGFRKLSLYERWVGLPVIRDFRILQ